jgi:hypothetical protein
MRGGRCRGVREHACSRSWRLLMTAARIGRIASKLAPTGMAPDPRPAPGFCLSGLPTPTVAVECAQVRSAALALRAVRCRRLREHACSRSWRLLMTAARIGRIASKLAPTGMAPDPRPAPGFCLSGLLTPTAAVECAQVRSAALALRAVRCRGLWEHACSRSWRLLMTAARIGRIASKLAPTGMAPDPRPAPGFCGRGLLTPTAAVSRVAVPGSGSVAAKAAPAGN